VTLKIERYTDRRGTTIRLSGRVQAEHLEEIDNQMAGCGPRVFLDLEDVTVVAVDVVHFLGKCESGGIELLHCPAYIREWISREGRQNE
jgi:hypothetical protein